jgi:hypothetical protein
MITPTPARQRTPPRRSIVVATVMGGPNMRPLAGSQPTGKKGVTD